MDNGSAINIMPLKTMKQLGIPIDDLLQSWLMIQGFNQGSQRALGKVHLDMYMDGMESSALVHVIDARTTYCLIYENMVVYSMLHQCFKYYKNGEVRKVMADTNPFNEAESHYADAKFYFEVTIDDEVPVEDDSKKRKGLFNEVHSSSTEDPKEKSKTQKQQITSTHSSDKKSRKARFF